MSQANTVAASGDALRDHFLYWQCRLRQIAMRKEGGRPSSGMRPRVLRRDGGELSPAMTVLILPKAPGESTEFFRHQVRKSKDPKIVYDQGLAYLQATYYQRPEDFSDVMTALFGPASETAGGLLAADACVLEFAQFSQHYGVPCTVRRLSAGEPAYDATFWHNRLFNPNIPSDPCILALTPDWAGARAEPPV